MSGIAAGFGSVHSPGYTLYVGAVKVKVGHGGNCCGHGSPHQVHCDTQTLPDPRPDRPSFRPTRANLPLGPLSMTLGINVAEKSHVCRAARVADGRNIMINNSDIAVGTLPCSLPYYPADAGMLKGGNLSLLLEAGSNLQQQYGHRGDSCKYHIAAVSAQILKSFVIKRQGCRASSSSPADLAGQHSLYSHDLPHASCLPDCLCVRFHRQLVIQLSVNDNDGIQLVAR
ncbi:hypothetical protein CABS01_14416 [Colletotrichum abscissum]|uniref:uncharacterized protein n=1 Tax=Colletotrichum abscissum TaxID=1671311 RepID=UPI0027D65A9F|nr:uncharacterized protein CABS01_14416 [Colletotrichum abscissum]KAK1480278.1 hypothetical protein CABS01_14416 [Colletotrichum abscissum]